MPVSFVGSFFSVHRSRTKLLEHLARQVDLKVWGPSIGENSPLRQIYQGQAWGTDMYRILRQSKIVVNHHGDVPPYANNMRLFEATGMGALLITDWKENLRELFEPEVEVVPFRTDEECANRVRYYLEHDGEREAIAAAGQRRTLRDHTYLRRAEELVELVKKVKS